MARILKRKIGGLEAQKFEFDVEVLSAAELPVLNENVYVFWTRGPKVAMSKDVTADGEGNAVWCERLSLICTMYRSSTGEYQEKSAKLSVKDKKRKRTVAEVKLDLSKYISGPESREEVVLPLKAAGLGKAATGKLKVVICARFVVPSNGVGDEGSEASGASELISEMSFGDEADLSDDDEGSVHSMGSSRRRGSTVDKGLHSLAWTPAKEAEALGAASAREEDGASRRVVILAEKLAHQEELNSDLREKNLSFASDVSSKQAEVEALQHQLNDAGAEVLRLRKENCDMLKHHAEMASALRQANDEAKSQADRYRFGEDSMTDDLHELRHQVDCLSQQKKQIETDAKATQAMLYQQIEDLRSSLGEGSASPEQGAFAGCREEGLSDSQLVSHLQEMLDMRGEELEEAKKRVQNYKEKIRELQEKQAAGEDRLRVVMRDLQQEQSENFDTQKRLQDLETTHSQQQREMETRFEHEKGALRVTIESLRTELSNVKQNVTTPPSKEVEDHVTYLEDQLVNAKVQWAQAEEEKDEIEFKCKELKKALAKGREINMQFAKRMTKLEVKLTKEREKTKHTKTM